MNTKNQFNHEIRQISLLLQSILNGLIYTNLWISVGAVALVFSSCTILEIQVDSLMYSLAFLGTLCIYNLTAFYLSQPTSPKFIFMLKHKKILQKSSIISGIGAAFLGLSLGFKAIIFLTHIGLIALLYTIRLNFRNPLTQYQIRLGELRQIPYLKTILVGYVWASVAVTLPFLTQFSISTDLSPQIAGIFLGQFLFIIGITLPFDIRDFRTDEAMGLKTFAQKGIRRTKFLSIICLVISGLLYFLFADVEFSKALILTNILAGFLTLFASPDRPELYYTGLIDGTIVLQALFTYLIINL